MLEAPVKAYVGPCICCGKRTVLLCCTESNQAYTYACDTCHLYIESWTWQELVAHVLTVENTEVPA